MNQGEKITLFSKDGPKRLERGDEYTIDGQRYYWMIDQDDLEADPIPYLAGNIDKLATVTRGEVRRNKYTSRNYQRRHPKGR